jgi:MoaA/NifB/PqqE/SkfB family radical SAM enzyme
VTRKSFEERPLSGILSRNIGSFGERAGWFFSTFFRPYVGMEASSICQLHCPACPTGSHRTKRGFIGVGYLRFEDFQRFVNHNSQIRNIDLSGLGELFLNPELGEILRYAYQKRVHLTAWTGVNLNDASEEILEDLARYRFRFITVALDGATDATYQIYRKGGNLSHVLRNIRRINEYKQKYRTNFPELVWQFILFGHNEHEIPKARAMANRLGMSFRTKLNLDPKLVRKESGIGVATLQEYKLAKKKEYLPCSELWNLPKINWDGRLLGCCCNRFGDFGNVFESGFQTCLQSERYEYAKLMLLGEKPPRADVACTHCPAYQQRIPQRHRHFFWVNHTLYKAGLGPNHRLSRLLFWTSL